MPNLPKAQLPSATQASAPRNWTQLLQFFNHTDSYTKSLVLFIQTYFGKVQTQLNAALQYGTLANRPPPANTTDLYHATDDGHIFLDEQSGGTAAWVPVAPLSRLGTQASRPSPGNAGDFYYSTDFQTLYEDNGSAWIPITSRFFFVRVIAPATTYTLPAAIGSMVQYAIKNSAGTSITVGPTGADTIDGNPSRSILNNGAAIFIDGVAAEWAVIGTA